jgi:hypothetical protein
MIRQRKPIQRRKKPQPKAPWFLRERYLKRRRTWGASKIRAAQLRVYREERRSWLKGKVCEWCQHSVCLPLDVHHTRGRLGELLNDKRFWKAVGRPCHDRIHQHPAEARAYGFLCQPGEWNTPVK